jgi:hypothetical protein
MTDCPEILARLRKLEPRASTAFASHRQELVCERQPLPLPILQELIVSNIQ